VKTAATVFWLALALLVGTMVVLMALVATGATVSIT
jgi:hypothetical protein